MSAATDLLLSIRALRTAKAHLAAARNRLRAGHIDTRLVQIAGELYGTEQELERFAIAVENPKQQLPLEEQP